MDSILIIISWPHGQLCGLDHDTRFLPSQASSLAIMFSRHTCLISPLKVNGSCVASWQGNRTWAPGSFYPMRWGTLMLAIGNNTMWDGECGNHRTEACNRLRAKCLGTHPQEASMTPQLHTVHGDLLPKGGQAHPAVEKPEQCHLSQGSNTDTEKSRQEHAHLIECDKLAFVSVYSFLQTVNPRSWIRKTSLKSHLKGLQSIWSVLLRAVKKWGVWESGITKTSPRRVVMT